MTSNWSRHPSHSNPRCKTAEWKRIRAKVLTRDVHICQIRGSRCTFDATDVDHVVPVSQGGTDDPSNCVAACRNCHKEKTAREAARGRNRWKQRFRTPPTHSSDVLLPPGLKR